MSPAQGPTWFRAYAQAASPLQESWPAGMKVMKATNIEPILLLHQQFSNDLADYKELRQKCQADPGLRAGLQASRSKAQGSGRKFADEVPVLRSKLAAMGPALSEASRNAQLNTQQKQSLVALLGVIKTIQTAVVSDWTSMGVIDGMLAKIDEATKLS